MVKQQTFKEMLTTADTIDVISGNEPMPKLFNTITQVALVTKKNRPICRTKYALNDSSATSSGTFKSVKICYLNKSIAPPITTERKSINIKVEKTADLMREYSFKANNRAM